MPESYGLRLAGAALLGLVLSSAIASAAPQAKIPEGEVLRVQGQKLYQAGDLEGAVKALRRAAALRPNDAALLFLFAQVLGDQGSYQDSEAFYLRTVSLYEQQQSQVNDEGIAVNKRNIATCLNNLAVVYLRDKRPADAQSALDRAMATWTPASSMPSRFYVTRGQVLEAQTQPDLAIQAYRSALASEPRNTDALLDLGTLLLARGTKDEALDVLRKGVAVNPKDAEMFGALGNALAAKNLWNEATAAYQNSLELRPDSPTILYDLGDALLHQRKFSAALQVLQKAHALAPEDGAIAESLSAVQAELRRKPAP
jgi:tetratricopeptide (TPR) repeat protein